MTQSVKYVLFKHVSLSLDPQNTHKTGSSSAHPRSQHIYCDLAYTVANTRYVTQKLEWKARTITPDM